MIEEQIGVGGMGAVYRATDTKFGTRVAIKQTFYSNTELGEAFEREARLLNGLHHHILPHVSDYFKEGHDHFLVMEYIEGDDLSELLKRGEMFPVETVLEWTLDLLDGLDHLHSQDPPVIHRDIKPNNMKLTSRGKIILLDFGMAKETTGNTEAAKSVFGYSRRYSPLEQIEGTGTDERSDIFSLGASVYHIITGTPPVDVLARVSAIVAGRPDPLIPAQEWRGGIPEQISAILNSALGLNSETRFESAKAMSRAIEHAMDDVRLASSAIPAAPPEAAIPIVLSDPIEPSQDKASASSAGHGVAVAAAQDRLDSPRVGQKVIPGIRVWRPNRRIGFVIAALLLISVIAMLATFRGSNTGEEAAATTTASADGAAAEPAAPEAQPDVTEQGVISGDDEQASADDLTPAGAITRNETATASKRSPNVATVEERTERPAQRKTQNKRSATTTRPRIVEPAFEQPSVSSIEAIMTGVPYERRRRWTRDDEIWIDDDRNRRRLRRMRRESRPRQIPFD